jgi:hypothetical protein
MANSCLSKRNPSPLTSHDENPRHHLAFDGRFLLGVRGVGTKQDLELQRPVDHGANTATCLTSNPGGGAGGTVGTATGIGNAYGCQQQTNGTATSLAVTAWSGTASTNFAAAAITYKA